MARKETLVQLTEELLAALDDEAGRRGLSRSAIIREAATAYLASSEERRIADAIVTGYERIPAGTPDAWGSPTDHGDAGARELLQRLDAEERAQGIDPW